jgi:hypothetical protein
VLFGPRGAAEGARPAEVQIPLVLKAAGGEVCCKTEAMNMLFLLEAAYGVIGVEFEPHGYGPWSGEVECALRRLAKLGLAEELPPEVTGAVYRLTERGRRRGDPAQGSQVEAPLRGRRVLRGAARRRPRGVHTRELPRIRRGREGRTGRKADGLGPPLFSVAAIEAAAPFVRPHGLLAFNSRPPPPSRGGEGAMNDAEPPRTSSLILDFLFLYQRIVQRSFRQSERRKSEEVGGRGGRLGPSGSPESLHRSPRFPGGRGPRIES